MHPSPFEIVAPRAKALRRTKRELLAASRLVEHQALTAGAHTVLVTFQDKRHMSEASRASYARLARSGTKVYAFARGLTSTYTPDSDGLITVALLPGDAVIDEWDIVLLSATGGQAFVARDLTPGGAVIGADLDRAFSWTRTDDVQLVEQAADALLSRLP